MRANFCGYDASTPAVPRRFHAWDATERVDLQARIFRNRQFPSGPGVVERFRAGVFGKGAAGLVRGGDARKIRECQDFERHSLEDGRDLDKLAAIGRGDEERFTSDVTTITQNCETAGMTLQSRSVDLPEGLAAGGDPKVDRPGK